MQKRRAIYACGLILLTLLALTQLSYSAASKLTIVPRAKLCVTEGTIEESPGGELIVNVPKMRVCQCLRRWTAGHPLRQRPSADSIARRSAPRSKKRPGPRMQVRPRTIRIAASAAAALCGPLRGSNNGHWCHSERSLRSEEALSVLTCSLRSNEYLGADSTQELFGAAASPAPRPSSLPPLHPRCSPA